MLAVEILVQAVVIVGPVAEQKWCRLVLARSVARSRKASCSGGKRMSILIASFQRLAISASGG